MEHRRPARANLLSIPEDIHHLIITEIRSTSPSTLLSLARVCRDLNTSITPYIYRTLLVPASDDVREQSLERLLQEDGERFSKHIRDIQIERTIDSALLLRILDKISNLSTFGWHANAKVDPEVLDKLTTKWPAVRLSVKNFSRHNKTANGDGIDEPAISSPHLQTLEYTVFTDYKKPNGIIAVQSEWSQITRLLRAGGNCRFLHLNVDALHSAYLLSGVTESPATHDVSALRLNALPLEAICFTLTCGGKLPFDRVQCPIWKRSLDWSRINRLDFDCVYPLAFFSEMTGLVPNLKSLRCGLSVSERDDQGYDVARETVAFLDSIDGLEELDLTSLDKHEEEVWPAIERHNETLRTLILRPSFGYYDVGFPKIGMQEISETFSNLTHLGLHMFVPPNGNVPDLLNLPPMKERSIFRRLMSAFEKRSVLDEIALHSAMNLSTLHLGLHLPDGGTSFAAKYSPNVAGSAPFPDMDQEGSKTSAIEIAEAISAIQASPLRTLNLEFHRMSYQDRFQGSNNVSEMKLQRGVRDDLDPLTDDRWKATGPCEWNARWRGGDCYERKF